MNLLGGPLTGPDLAALKESGIPAELAQRALLRRVGNLEGAQLVGRKPGGSVDYSGIVFSYVLPGEDYARAHRLRRDRPDYEAQPDGRPKEKAKYLAAPGASNLLYFVPGTAPAWLKDSELPIIIVEGEKKCLSLWQLGWHNLPDSVEHPRWLPIGVSGIWNWRGTTGKATAPDGSRIDVKGPIADLKRIHWKNRKVVVVFDANVQARPDIQMARLELTKYLRTLGARVHWFQWPLNIPVYVNGIDDLAGCWGAERTLETLAEYTEPAPLTGHEGSPREFAAISEDRYALAIPGLGIVFDIDRLRRERHELIGELTVKCELPGARTYNGVLIASDFNLSASRTRKERATLLAERAQTKDLDWLALVEEFCQRVLEAERRGEPAIDLRTVPLPDPEHDSIRIHGFELPRRHPSVLFGDGGSAKSYLGLYLGGCLAQQGLRVGVFDWELEAPDHRFRLRKLFGDQEPEILYARCYRPLTSEADRLRRMVREQHIDFGVYDSVGYASGTQPEAAESALAYFRVVRKIGIGRLHIAHVTKAEGGDQTPFGSIFWHNSARATWFIKASDESPDGTILDIGIFQRKSNLSAKMRAPLAFRITFGEERTTFQRIEPGSVPVLAEKMTIRQRMTHLLARGAMSIETLAEEIGATHRVRRAYRPPLPRPVHRPPWLRIGPRKQICPECRISLKIRGGHFAL